MAPGSTFWSSIRKLSLRLFRRKEDARLRSLADFLGQVPLFAPLSRGMLLELAEAVHERRYRRDEYLYYQGDPGIGLYVVQRGHIRLVVEQGDEVAEVGVARERDLMGATCLLGGGALRRAESAQAAADTVVLGLFSPEYRTLQRRHPKTGAALATLIARHFALTLDVVREQLTSGASIERAATELIQADREALGRMTELPSW